MRKKALLLILAATAGLLAYGQESRFSIGCLSLSSPEAPLVAGGEYLVQELNRRTQVDPFPEKGFAMLSPDLKDLQPFLWIVVGADARIDTALIEKLERFLASGGTVFAEPDGSAASLNKLRSLSDRIFREQGPKPMSEEDLLARTFYFLSAESVRNLRSLKTAGRLVWIDSSVPVLKVLSSPHPIDNAEADEALRISINVVMYTLTGSYKDDLTHVRYLFRRRK